MAACHLRRGQVNPGQMLTGSEFICEDTQPPRKQLVQPEQALEGTQKGNGRNHANRLSCLVSWCFLLVMFYSSSLMGGWMGGYALCIFLRGFGVYRSPSGVDPWMLSTLLFIIISSSNQLCVCLCLLILLHVEFRG